MTIHLASEGQLLKDEPGSDQLDSVLAESIMSSVNWAEVMQKSVAAGVEVDGLLHDLQALGLRIEPFTVEDGEMTGRLWEQTRQAGLSLGDRACLSLGLRLGVPVLTCDRAWASLSLSVKIQAIRSDVCHRIAPLISKPKITNAID